MKPVLEGTIGEDSYLEDYDIKIKVLTEPSNEYFSNLEKDRREYDKLILINGLEPHEVNNIRENIILYHKLFDKVYSFDTEVLKNCKNSARFAFGGCFVLTNSKGEPIEKETEFGDFYTVESKKFKVSFIKSPKSFSEGQKLRHQIPPLLTKRHFEVYYPQHRILYKHSCFIDSMYHISVESAKHENYFTEKIIDCFISKTIPIYWGCPNIGEYFNKNGILMFENLGELNQILNSLTPEFFKNKKDVVEENYQKAKEYACFYTRLNKLIREA